MAKKVVEQGKALIQSKTFWFNILTIVIAVAGMFGFGSFEPSPEVKTVLEILTLISGGNIGLRAVTKEPIKSIA